ncbi:MAG: PAS domain S-box protein [Chloroflexi bacterium]|nr:MAG: PAS domain S-box protein [Chloroflexota bacterium]
MHTGDPDESSLSPGLIDLQNPGVMAGFLEIAFDAAVTFDAQERITYWNPAAEQMYGWTAQEALGKTPAKLFWLVNTPEEKKSRRQRQSRLKRGETLRGEHTSCRKDGSSLRVQYAARAVFDAAGKVIGYQAIYRDISAGELALEKSKENEESLRARTEEIETLLEVSPIAIFVAHDPDCVRISGNPAGYRMVGLPENPELNISKSAPAQERPTYGTFRNGVEVPAQDLPMQKAARLGVEVREDELELRFEDGSQKFLYAFAKPLFDSQGKSRGAIAAMLDISDRRRAEERLERSNQKLNEILASIQDDFYVIDRDWIFVYANRQFTSKLGKEPEDLIGNNVWKMFPKHVGMILEENFRAAMEKRETRRFEMPGKYTDAWYKITVFPSPEGITVLGSDISERKHAEEALRDHQKQLQLLNETLEQQVQEKTAEVRSLASDLVKAVQHERHRISHILHDDLQQRIYGIRMQLTFLHDELQRENEAARKEVSDIEKQLAEILEVTRHLSIDLSPPILSDEGLSHAIHWLAIQMGQRYGLPIDIQASSPFAIADEALHVLLFNCVRELLFNIVKHAQASQAMVALQWADAGLQIEVRDDGRGFPVNLPERQVAEEMSGEDGLRPNFGLSTIRHQLNLFGGRMEIQSEPGTGTRIVLIVPVVEGG